MKNKASNVKRHPGKIDRKAREKRYGHRGVVLWLTGRPSSGKSTLAAETEKMIFDMGVHAYVLDGDNVRLGLNKDLGFSPEDRAENVRRVGEVARLFVDSGAVVIAALVSPCRRDREAVRRSLKLGDFIEVYVKADLKACEKRDPKGLYRKALAGKIRDFTGLSAPYEEPERPELVIDSTRLSIKDSAGRLVEYLIARKIIKGE